jgi:hypothetical protein
VLDEGEHSGHEIGARIELAAATSIRPTAAVLADRS